MKYGTACRCLLLVMLAGGCSWSSAPLADDRLNTPLTREDADELMRAFDRDAVDPAGGQEEASHLRQRLTGRLLAAGMSDAEIEDWIHSPVPGSTGSTQ